MNFLIIKNIFNKCFIFFTASLALSWTSSKTILGVGTNSSGIAQLNDSGTWDTPFLLTSTNQVDATQSNLCSGSFLTSWNGLTSGDLNFSSLIKSAPTKTVAVFNAMVGSDYAIEVNIN